MSKNEEGVFDMHCIKIIRKVQKISQDQLAKKSGISRATINRIENGEHIPNIDTICKLCKALGVKLAIVFDLEEITNNLKIKDGTAERELFSTTKN